QFLVHQALDDPARFFLYETYDSGEVFVEHRRSQHFPAEHRNNARAVADRTRVRLRRLYRQHHARRRGQLSVNPGRGDRRRSTMTFTPWESIPADLRAEFDEAGLDGADVHAAVLRALEEDLPGGSVDVTSVATIA